MDAIEPNTVWLGTVGICIGERGGNPTAIPLLTTDRAGVATDARVEVDHEPIFFAGAFAGRSVTAQT